MRKKRNMVANDEETCINGCIMIISSFAISIIEVLMMWRFVKSGITLHKYYQWSISIGLLSLAFLLIMLFVKRILLRNLFSPVILISSIFYAFAVYPALSIIGFAVIAAGAAGFSHDPDSKPTGVAYVKNGETYHEYIDGSGRKTIENGSHILAENPEGGYVDDEDVRYTPIGHTLRRKDGDSQD